MSAQLKFQIIGEDKNASASFKKVSTAADELHGHATKLSTIMAGVFGGEALFHGAEKMVDFLNESVQSAVEDQRAEELLTQTLHNVTHATSEQVEAIKARLLADGEHLGITQDEMMPAYQKLILITHSQREATSLLTLTENVAAAKHIQMADAAALVGKMTMGNAKAFKEFGLVVTSTTNANKALTMAQNNLASVQDRVRTGALSGKSAISALSAAHQRLETAQKNAKAAALSQADAMRKVTEYTKGDAEKTADTYAGRLKQMHVQFHDLQVTIGNAVLPKLTELMGFVMQKAVPALASMAHFVQQNAALFIPLAGAIIGYTAGLKAAAIAEVLFGEAMANIPIVRLVTLIFALAAGLVYAYKKVGWFRDFVNESFKLIKNIVQIAVNFIKDH